MDDESVVVATTVNGDTEISTSPLVILTISLPTVSSSQLNANFKLAVPPFTTLGDIRTHIVDSPECQFNTCFYLAFNGDRLNDSMTVADIPAFDPTTCSLSIVTDEFNEREVRIQIGRLREILSGFKSSTTSSFGINVGISYLMDVSGSHDINAPSQKEKVEKPSIPLMHPFQAYDFELNDELGNLESLLPKISGIKENDCLKSLTLSCWNPPPIHRRNSGDIMYLAVTTNELALFHITCSVYGFYVSRSTDKLFDPTLKNLSAPTLPGILSQISPQFKTKFTALHEATQKRHPHTYLLPTTLQATPWIVPEPQHAPDCSRTLDIVIMAADNSDIVATRDWNEDLCLAAALQTKNASEKVNRAQTLHRTYSEFVDAAMKGVVAIVQKYLAGSIGAVSGGGEADGLAGQMFLNAGIFYSLARDQGDSFSRIGGAAAAHVAVSKDVDGVSKVDALCASGGGTLEFGVNTLGTCVVDYKGIRIVAQTVIPGILKRQQPSAAKQSEKDITSGDDIQKDPIPEVIVYGSIDSGKTILSGAEFHATAEKIASVLHLDAHKVIDASGVEHLLATPLDVKGIVGNDGRKYLLDLSRLTPVDFRFLEEIDTKDSNFAPYPHRMPLLRHELVDIFYEHKLGKYVQEKAAAEGKDEIELPTLEEFDVKFNPDAFLLPCEIEDSETAELESQKEKIREISKFLNDTVIPAMALELAAKPNSVPLDGEKLTKFFHDRGINMRYLGKMTEILDTFDISVKPDLLIQEMVARAAKVVLRDLLQEIPLHLSSECVSHFLNCFFNGKDSSIEVSKPKSVKNFAFYDLTSSSLDERIRLEVSSRFRFPSSQLPDNLFINRKVLLLRSICNKVGIQIKAKTYQFSDVPGDYQIFAASDILNLYPVAKYPEPKCAFGDEIQEHALYSVRQGDKQVAQEIMTEALNIFEQVFGPVHQDAARVQRQLAVMHHENGEYEICKLYQRRALLISERLSGFDDPDTLQQYLNLGFFESLTGHYEVGFKYMQHALTYLKMHCAGNFHPELAAADAQIAMLLSESNIDRPTSLKFFAHAVAIYEKVMGQEADQTMRAKELYFNSLLQNGDWIRAHEIHNTMQRYNLSKFAQDTEKIKEIEASGEKVAAFLKQRVLLETENGIVGTNALEFTNGRKGKGKANQQKLVGVKSNNSNIPSETAAVAAGPIEPNKGHLSIDELMKFIDGGKGTKKKSGKKGKKHN
ncbi:Intracellular distribution of mitochondria [Physocladia obscura]|uniref:Intracellular distribution of mitochondria n=1 Tax=Physocladia obscura TaxID=109957 RepID=A0AAD5XHW5_9FUNG|nr:Intracellular distribution of mitochondria [Physocladia obscura]